MDNLFIQGMDLNSNSIRIDKQLGENNAPEYTASGVNDYLVTLFFSLVRNIPDEKLNSLMNSIIDNINKTKDINILINLIVLIFQTRNCRGGKGEKKLFYKMFLRMYKEYPQTMISLLPLISHYGYYKDYLLMLELSDPSYIPLHIEIIKIIAKQLKEDKEALMNNNNNISLCAKYMPRENHHFSRGMNQIFFLMFVKELTGGDSKSYLKKYRTEYISPLTKYLNVTENYMASKRYEEINFKNVPSKCLNINRKAFLNELLTEPVLSHQILTGNRFPNDENRIKCRNNLKLSIVNNEIKGKQLEPHIITNKLGSSYGLEQELLEKQWDKIKDSVKESMNIIKEGAINLGRLIPMIDVSGSMNGIPMDVAIALGIMVSELTTSVFQNRALSFTDEATWINMTNSKNLKEKVNIVRSAKWGGSTNIINGFDQIIKVLKTLPMLTQDDIPDLIIFSDMQFNTAFTDGYENSIASQNFSWNTTYDIIKNMFLELGNKKGIQNLKPSNIIFWNLRGDTTGYPANKDEEGIQMLSGYSPSLLKLLLKGEPLVQEIINENGETIIKKKTPESTVLAALYDEIYNPVREILKLSKEGLFINQSN
jgi:hypothetical protein